MVYASKVSGAVSFFSERLHLGLLWGLSRIRALFMVLIRNDKRHPGLMGFCASLALYGASYALDTDLWVLVHELGHFLISLGQVDVPSGRCSSLDLACQMATAGFPSVPIQLWEGCSVPRFRGVSLEGSVG